MLKKSEPELIDEVERRLVCKFAQLPVGLIATTVEDAHMRFEQSVIRDYIPGSPNVGRTTSWSGLHRIPIKR